MVDIEIDGAQLNKTQYDSNGGIEEVRYISNIHTSDRRGMVEHKIPGMEGSVFQNLGRSPVNISFDGTFEGKSAKSNLEMLRSKFQQGTPLPFNSNLSGAAGVTKVLIENLLIEEIAGIRDRYRYSITLSEYKEPPPEPVTPPSQDDEAKKSIDEVAEKTVEGINFLTGKVLDSEGEPKSGITILATDSQGETYTGGTNEEGIYRIENLPPGKYKVTVEAEEYAGVEEVAIIGSGAEEEAAKKPEEEKTKENEGTSGEKASEETEEEKPGEE